MSGRSPSGSRACRYPNPTTLAAHRFWEAADAEERMQKRIHFAKNLSILGGLLLSAVD